MHTFRSRRRPVKTFARRLTQQYVTTTVGILVGVMLTSMFVAASVRVSRTANAMSRVAVAAVKRLDDDARRGILPRRAAAQLVDDFDFRPVYIGVFDKGGGLLAGTVQPENGYLRFFRAPPVTLRTSRGSVAVTLAPGILAAELRRYMLALLPIALSAIVFSILSARELARRAVVPLVEVRSGLLALANGVPDLHPVSVLGDAREIADVGQAFNGAAAAIKRAKDIDALQTQRMQRFVADSGHQLRTPITVMMAYADILENAGGERVASERHALAAIREEARRMRSLVDKLIVLARLERPAIPHATRPVNVTLLLEDLAQQLQPIAGGRLNVEADADHLVDGDEEELREAFAAVAENALRYAPDGVISLTVGRRPHSPDVEVSVRDRGPGFDPEDIAFVFDRFYRGRRQSQATPGSGLGLAIARTAIERASGSIDVGTAPDGGAIVRLTLRALGAPVI